MVNEKQFEKGEAITTVAAASIHILNDGWVYFNDRLMPPSWAVNWSLASLRQFTRAGRLHYAVRRAP
jgi:hypothetical protein